MENKNEKLVKEKKEKEEVAENVVVYMGDEIAVGEFAEKLGKPANESINEESFSNGLLEYPQYTRPEIFLDKKVPEVLISGHHENINKWRKEQSENITKIKRPDLLVNKNK